LYGPNSSISAPELSASLYAAGAVLILTVINIIGVKSGTGVQNLLTVLKVLGLLLILAVALISKGYVAESGKAVASTANVGFGLAMVFVMWTYGGWNEIAYVAAEVKEPRRNITRSLVFGLVAVMAVYLLVNAAFLYSLGYEGLRNSKNVAGDVLGLRFGAGGARVMNAIVVISALGALNGYIFTSPRVYYAMGTEYRILSPLGYWSRRLGTPVVALIIQSLIILTLVYALGSKSGFDSMVALTAAVAWIFFAMTGLSLFVLRQLDPDLVRPYPIFGYPLVPFLFVLMCFYMIHSSIGYKPLETMIAILILLAGVPIYWASKRLGKRASPREPAPVRAPGSERLESRLQGGPEKDKGL
jgi:amino acid transporter